jgi:hypothetical protein
VFNAFDKKSKPRVYSAVREDMAPVLLVQFIYKRCLVVQKSRMCTLVFYSEHHDVTVASQLRSVHILQKLNSPSLISYIIRAQKSGIVRFPLDASSHPRRTEDQIYQREIHYFLKNFHDTQKRVHNRHL